MARKVNGTDRARRLLAQEAARIIVDHGIRDYGVAKKKAAERLGLHDRGSLPGNAEIEAAVSEHLTLFGREAHGEVLRQMRETAVAAMSLLGAYSPRLVGPVLNGTADAHSPVSLHVFTDSPEMIAATLAGQGLSYRSCERRLKSRRDRNTPPTAYSGYDFTQHDTAIELTVFPFDGIRQAPISPIDGRPMRRADLQAVRRLLEE